MPTLRLTHLVAGVAAASVLAVGGVAVAGQLSGPTVNNQANGNRAVIQSVAGVDPTVLASFSTFEDTSEAPSQAVQQQLRDAFGGDATAEHGAIAHADFSLTRSAPIAGSSASAYLAPSGKKVCIVVPDPADGFAASCQTVAAIEDGRGVVTITPPKDSARTDAIVAVAVADGDTAPTLTSASGRKIQLAVHGNLAAASASIGDQLRTEGGTILITP
jgi:hypothetical protein